MIKIATFLIGTDQATLITQGGRPDIGLVGAVQLVVNIVGVIAQQRGKIILLDAKPTALIVLPHIRGLSRQVIGNGIGLRSGSPVIAVKTHDPIIRDADIPAHQTLIVACREIAHIGDIIEIELILARVYLAAIPVARGFRRRQAQRRHHLRTPIDTQTGRVIAQHRDIATQSAESATHTEITGRPVQVGLGKLIGVEHALRRSGARARHQGGHGQTNYFFHLVINICFIQHLPALTTSTTAIAETTAATAATASTERAGAGATADAAVRRRVTALRRLVRTSHAAIRAS